MALLAGAAWAAEAGYEAIISVDADGQHDPREASLLLAEATNHDWPAIVIGSRRMVESTVPKSSLFGRAFSNFWVRMECGQELADTQSGYRLYPVAEMLQLALRSRRYDFEVEVLARAAWAGIPIYSVSVSVHYPPGAERTSHFHQLKDNFRLTILHTRLVIRALMPFPHRRLIGRSNGFVAGEAARVKSVVLHPIKFIRQICLEHTTPFQLAVAVWLGVFLGALPLIAVHTVVILYVAHRLHINKLAAVGASQFCMPPLVPVLCMQIGYFCRHGQLLWDINWETMVVQIHERLLEWFFGSLLLGPAFGLLLGGVTYLTVSRLRGKSCSEALAMKNE
ncbi:MAG: hypothetical protein A2511_02585 [Deltaproteobacteria bacterium RIFOXYD12_FULL_50_9]|nr:MAG: hypothetical protein A2511_02585 [Deltaproteobacteria bacterium RIFOXYD12_FULL_50_9]